MGGNVFGKKKAGMKGGGGGIKRCQYGDLGSEKS